MKKYVCSICGYVYDPEKGEPSKGVQPGTPFDALPEEFDCPVCSADTSAFEPA
ncbi:MAG: rubredoxin [Ruminococcus sp.]|jgi:rubredoxin|nr:rubredoxin [Ruminococcus sp.]